MHCAQVVPWGSNDALALVQRKLNVDILITGHTHEFQVSRAPVGMLPAAFFLISVLIYTG